MPDKLPRGSIELLASAEAGRAVGGDYVQWATAALVEGFDSPALRQLAGLESTSGFDARPLFDQAVQELDLRLPATRADLLRTYLRVLARQAVDGTLSPDQLLEIVHREVVGPLNHPGDLDAWCFLWEALDPVTFDSLDDEGRDRAALQLARAAAAE